MALREGPRASHARVLPAVAKHREPENPGFLYSQTHPKYLSKEKYYNSSYIFCQIIIEDFGLLSFSPGLVLVNQIIIFRFVVILLKNTVMCHNFFI